MFLRHFYIALFLIILTLVACAAPTPAPTTSTPIPAIATSVALPSAVLATLPAPTLTRAPSPLPPPTASPAQPSATAAPPSSTPAPANVLAPTFRWTNLTAPASSDSSRPAARYDHALAFDHNAQQLVLFGGRDGGAVYGDTWLYDLKQNVWREVSGAGPSPRFGLASAYDPITHAVYLFGGQKSDFYNDTWKFDLASETWSELQTQGEKPDIRYGHGVTLDPDHNQLIISHGFARDGRHNDTWALDLATNQWRELTPAGDKPLNRCLHDIAFAPASSSVYLFGGCSSGFGPCPQGDLWSLDLASDQWTLLSPAGETPAARQNPSIIVNSATGNLLLFGGQGDTRFSDLWQYDPTAKAWTHIPAEGPSPRSSQDTVYDSLNNRVYLFGGSTTEGASNELWTLELGM